MERTKIPYILTIIGTFLMLICIFLPYGSAKKDFADAMREMPDHVEIEELDLTSKDMINISMFKYTRIYYTLRTTAFLKCRGFLFQINSRIYTIFMYAIIFTDQIGSGETAAGLF